MQPTNTRNDLWMDLALVAFLVVLCVVARLLPHAPGFLPVAASGLFAARVLRIPALAIVVPVLAMILSDAFLPGEDWRIQAVGFAAIAIPAIAGIATRRWNSVLPTIATVIGSSTLFFLLSNGAVWALASAGGNERSILTALIIDFVEKFGMLVDVGAGVEKQLTES